MEQAFIVGITGGSGSGKTTFIKNLTKLIGKENVCTVSQDNYYIDKDKQPEDKKGIKNFDTPYSIDLEKFYQDITKLKNGEEVQIQEYTFNNASATPKMLKFVPKKVIILEGIFVFHDPRVLEIIDLKLFIEAKAHLKLSRRIKRDNVERGYDINDVLYRYENHVMPAYENYIKPHKENVDIIVRNDRNFDVALDVVKTFLLGKI
ncbi:uridine kinase [Flammeovirga yaeyamensis]|uniref:uridine/cytidine kinase n=1 Tax=Flammeovirga yaeyamensis TaxID=367791 RepID=A0AAX1N7N6_9BACT|nr:uridine kinase [Flammeovirga yaeyamensis]MBB3700358.1 uridine kinase [Flammeovirga yaeyamensis]NMF37016.1 uridine kinase [Flammeovirga yaeyamensis]QWG02441.1 uridine kinase [Flammeovirga yaeyamensis]